MNLFLKHKVEIRSSKFGKGIFATEETLPDTVICKIEGPLLSFKETLDLGLKESHAIQIDFNKYILCEPPFLYSNHSCSPNCGINSKLEFITLQHIKADEELLWDYSTSMLERSWTMKCLCGSPECREIVRDFDFLPVEKQVEYLNKNIVLPFIYQHLQKAYLKSA